MEIQRPALPGGLHQLLGAAPVLVPGILLQQLLLQRLDARAVAPGIQFGPLLHGGKGRPALGVDDIRPCKGLRHGVGLGKGAAGAPGVLAGHLLHLGHDLVALGVGQHHIHAEAGHQPDHPLGHRQGLTVAG